jgi:outer membrane protein assembly factor BamB
MKLGPPLALSLVALAMHAEDWSRFRGPNGSGVSSDTGFPATFNNEHNLAWRTPVRSGKSSPILTERHIFLTAWEGNHLYIQCFDRRSGKLLWERSEARPRQEFGNTLNDPASVTPVTDGENVYAFFADFGFLSYDAGGRLRWKTPLGPFTNIMGLSTSPVLAGDVVVLVVDQQDDSYIAAFDRRNGELRWRTAREEKDGWATPVLYQPDAGGAPQVVTTSRGQLGAHSVTDGARTWTHNRLSPAIVSSPVLHQGTLFTFGYGNEAAAPFSNQLARYDKNQDGKLSREEAGNNAFLVGIGRFEGNRDGIVEKEEWDEKQRQVLAPSSLLAIKLDGEHPSEMWRYERNFVGVIPSPLLYDGILYVIRNGGILTSLDARTGEVTKTGRVQGAIAGYSASPVAADGKVYLANEDGKIAVLRAGKEWDVLAVNDLGEPCFATPALSGGSIYLRTSEALYRFAAPAPTQ